MTSHSQNPDRHPLQGQIKEALYEGARAIFALKRLLAPKDKNHLIFSAYFFQKGLDTTKTILTAVHGILTKLGSSELPPPLGEGLIRIKEKLQTLPAAEELRVGWEKFQNAASIGTEFQLCQVMTDKIFDRFDRGKAKLSEAIDALIELQPAACARFSEASAAFVDAVECISPGVSAEFGALGVSALKDETVGVALAFFRAGEFLYTERLIQFAMPDSQLRYTLGYLKGESILVAVNTETMIPSPLCPGAACQFFSRLSTEPVDRAADYNMFVMISEPTLIDGIEGSIPNTNSITSPPSIMDRGSEGFIIADIQSGQSTVYFYDCTDPQQAKALLWVMTRKENIIARRAPTTIEAIGFWKRVRETISDGALSELNLKVAVTSAKS